MRLSIFFSTIFFVVLLYPASFILADNNGNSSRLVAVELQSDDEVDAKLNSGTNLRNPNDQTAIKSTYTNNNDNNNKEKEIIWGKSAIAKEKKAETKTEPQPTPEIRFAKTTPVNQANDNLKEFPISKTATKTNQHYTDLTITTPKPLPQPPAAASANKKNNNSYLLKSSRRVGSVDLVETSLLVTGDVKQLGNEQQKTTTEKMEVVAGFRYEERIHKSPEKSNPLVSVRQYNLAKAKMRIGKDFKTPELKDKTRTIVSQLEGDKVVLFSPNGALRGEELLLIEDLPGNTLTLDRLLPNKEVKIGESWQISDAELRSFLSIDAVTESRVEAVLTAVADNIAIIEIVGEVNGIYLGAETKMSVKAKYQFDLNIQRINWLGVLIQEDRSVSHVGPGFDLVAKLQINISPLGKPQVLTDEFMSEINVLADNKVLGLKYDGGKGAWRFAHDRNWYVFQDDSQTTVLRRLHYGELVAQCNIADMGKVDIKTMTTLDRFTKEISSGLGKNYKKVVAADQYTNDAGYQVYTVMIDGAVDDLPLRWIYNLLTAQDGRQTVVVFVIEAKMLKIFGDSDDMLLNTYRMIRKD
ncbi:MAG: hypothetical protein LBC74_09070 [Planctomycetaceae bacterium]|jgi:hypothetical protein|nr:hypothetical protein [Planctomycetaceae bacterium]